jgi:AraC-like DNA-binding protein
LDRDFEVVVGVLRDLAPQYEYRAAQLARGLQMTPRHLQRIFATALCSGPREWLNQRRMLAATHLLTTGCSIKDTAYRLGFRNPSQFSRDFRGQFGISPSMFLREQLRARRTSRSNRAECPAPPR